MLMSSTVGVEAEEAEEAGDDVPERVLRKRHRLVDEAVATAVRRMEADDRQREILRRAAERTAERITEPFGSADGDAVESLFLD